MLVTGGAGFFGFRLGKALARQGISVILLDLHQPQWELPNGAAFLQVRLTRTHFLEKVVIQQYGKITLRKLDLLQSSGL